MNQGIQDSDNMQPGVFLWGQPALLSVIGGNAHRVRCSAVLHSLVFPRASAGRVPWSGSRNAWSKYGCMSHELCLHDKPEVL